MSDLKPRRAPRHASPTEFSAPEEKLGEPIAGVPAPIIAPRAAEQPDPPDMIAAAIAEIVHASTAETPPAPLVGKQGALDSWTAFADAQAVLARGFEQFAVELTGVTRTGMVAGADAALALLAARTVAEAVEINAGLARRGVNAMIEGSAKLSEIGIKTVTDASRPLLTRLGASWSGVFPD